MTLKIQAKPFPLSLTRGKESGIVIPQLLSAEIGNVNGYTVVTVWDAPVTDAPPVIIEVNGAAQVIDSSEIQVDTTIVYYVIPIPWHGSDDVLTINDTPVTNNIVWNAFLDLASDVGVTQVGGLISAWLDQSVNGNDFIQSDDSKKPISQIVDGDLAVRFDGVDDLMTAAGFANNLSNVAGFVVFLSNESGGTVFLSKFGGDYNGAFWWIEDGGGQFYAQSDSSNGFGVLNVPPFANQKYVCSFEMFDKSSGHAFVDGNNDNESVDSIGTLGDYTNNANVTLGTYPGFDADAPNNFYRILLCKNIDPGNWAIDRDALTARLADRYGVTL